MSTLPDGYRLLQVPAQRQDEFVAVDRLAFVVPADPAVDDVVPFAVPDDRMVAVEAPDGEFAAVHGSFPFRLPVPGGAVPCAGLTWVGVRPDHRRRGLLRAMVRAHLDRALERGEVVSALFASEPVIYGRFGYGCAADNLRMTLPRGAALRAVPGSADLVVRLEAADETRHGALVHDLHERVAAARPGWATRTTPALRVRALADPPPWRDGAEPLLVATVTDATGAVRGAATFARKAAWEPTGPAFVVRVRQLLALDAAATHRLWSFLLDLDLTATVETPMLPVDDPLTHLLVDPRPARTRLEDNVWVRVLDLPVALAARRYAAPVDVVLDVRDALLPANAGRWRLVAGASGAAEVTRTGAEPDVTLDVRELGALYLGGRSLAAQAAAGLVQVRGGADVAAVAAAFAWPVAPVCSWIF
ncbi:GNAT family N-acetyltransferase [Cellulomonas shaoxiangyii]|uniref:GNAT family N-acetyltransferase n=1 Tax=Cellulomonas shaoxiangyii TaxID=2566013 RepID=A0A4P7SKQ3_9CELL|nr:GNAT family N-acetyltransferase [Cellulomonas shaoxiangyii]QCB94057.1 GNAT family N-acetyltransferase [Cellulomonas shaoxiangyii]TGY85754.1 GNAT family N-acetyltransferase [Cellulomonas shaoxiangyii]